MKLALLYAHQPGEEWNTPRGVHDELIGRGHTVDVYNLYHNNGSVDPISNAPTYSSQGFEQFCQACRGEANKPDAAIVMDYGPFDCRLMNKRYFPGVVLLLEAGDTPQSFEQHAHKAHRFHAVVTPDFRSAARLRAMGVRSRWLPHWADQRVFHARPDVSEVYDCVTTCGPRGNGLTEEVERALGPSFNNRRFFQGVEHSRRLCKGRIVFQCSQHKEITRRIFEGMASGKLVITDRLSRETRIDRLFEEDIDIVYYDDAEDAVAKIRYYLSHDQERQTIATSGYEKVMRRHTVANRVDVIESLIRELKAEHGGRSVISNALAMIPSRARRRGGRRLLRRAA